MAANRRSDAARVREMSRRILQVYRGATAADALEGLAWYRGAADVAAALSAGTAIEPDRAAAVIAALSPRCAWSQNVTAAAIMIDAAARGLEAPRVAGTFDNRAKAWSIARGADIETTLRGPKVRAFYRNITGDVDAVTVDVWTARAAEGRENRHAPAGKRYRLIAAAYRRAADIIGIAPRDMQATVWVATRKVARDGR